MLNSQRLRAQSSPVNITISAQSGAAPTSWKRARLGAPETNARMCHGARRRALARPAHLARRRHWRCTAAADGVHPPSLTCRLLSHSDPRPSSVFSSRPRSSAFSLPLPAAMFRSRWSRCLRSRPQRSSPPLPFPPVMGSFMLRSGLRLPNNMSCCGFFFHCPLSGSLVIGHSPEKKRKKKAPKN